MIIQHICRRFTANSWGGTETMVLGLVKGLIARGHESAILTSTALDQVLSAEIDGVFVRRFPYFYPYFGLTDEARQQMDMRAGNLFSFSLLSHLLRTSPPDVFHLHTGKRMGGIVRTAARYHRRPYVISLHGGVVDVPADEQARWTAPASQAWEWGRILGAAVGARRVLEDASAILCVNREEQKILQRQMPSKRVLWTSNTVNVARFRDGAADKFRAMHGIPADAKVILNVARIDEQKNQLQTIEVFDRVGVDVPGLWLLLAGASTNPAYAERVRARIAISPVAQRILCLGNVDASSQELVDMYHAADVFLLSSAHEPFGIVLLEAWAAGLPIVSSRVGGVPSFVDDGVNGLLYGCQDAGAAANHVKAVLLSRETAGKLHTQASEKVTQFDSQRASDELIEVYEEVRREYPVRS